MGEKLFKDSITAKRDRAEKIERLLEALKDEDKRDIELKKLLFSTETPEPYHGKYKLGEHFEKPCEGFQAPAEGDDAQVTEKRIFHCLAFQSAGKGDCANCSLQKQGEAVRLAEGSRMVDFEVPAYYCGTSVGEIDLVIEQGGILYAVEVKSPTSSELVLRMVAEVLTYTLGFPPEEYQPAIGFFEGSAQEREYYELMKENEKFRMLLDKAGITVFQMKKSGEQLTITALQR